MTVEVKPEVVQDEDLIEKSDERNARPADAFHVGGLNAKWGAGLAHHCIPVCVKDSWVMANTTLVREMR